MSANHPDPEAREERLYGILLSYLESAEAGREPDRGELLGRHPEFARDLHEFLEAQDRVEAVTVRLRRAGETSGPGPRRTPTAVPAGGAASTPPGDAPGWGLAARYRLLEEIGRGGMGVVFRGYDEHLGREVAFKFLREDYRADAAMQQRFAREAALTARLQHPGIVPVYDRGETADGRPFFTMGLVRGRTLAELLAGRPDPGWELPRFLKVFEQVCQAMAYAHAEGVVHRDLKPVNVMVSPFGVVQVMDWGLAKSLGGAPEPAPRAPAETAGGTPAARVGDDDEGQTVGDSGRASGAGCSVGTPAFMPPEQARGEGVDRRADVFGLGSILCVILTGRPPHAGCADAEARCRAGDLTDAFVRLDASPAEREVVGLAKRCLAADPRDRFPDAGAVAASVTAYLESDLRRAERDLVRFFDLSEDLFCVAGLDGYFRRVNVNFPRVLGYTEEELRARPFLDFVHPEDRARTVGAIELLARGLPVIRFVNRYRDARGDYRWFEWAGKSIPDEGVIFAVARDVTDRAVAGVPHRPTASGPAGGGAPPA
jgi:serine/threonine-protein kinase